MGSFLSRALLMVLGYTYPAYECFKAVEKNKPEVDQLLFWCQYWILVAMLTIFERIGDTFISWLPLYSEAKLALFIYLWHPKTKGTAYIYNFFLRSYVAKHETEIDRKLLLLRSKGREIGLVILQNAAYIGKTRLFEVLQYFSSQSTTKLPSTNHQNPTSASFSDDQQHSDDQPEQDPDHFRRTSTSSSQIVSTTTSDERANIPSQVVTKVEEKSTPVVEKPVSSSSSLSAAGKSSCSAACSKHDAVTRKLTRQKRGKWRIFRKQ